MNFIRLFILVISTQEEISKIVSEGKFNLVNSIFHHLTFILYGYSSRPLLLSTSSPSPTVPHKGRSLVFVSSPKGNSVRPPTVLPLREEEP